MTTEKLKNSIKKAPKSAGIYIFRNNSRFLYVGKAVNINSRLRNYLRPQDQRIAKMIEVATSLSFKTTDSDIEALILESQTIKKLRPQFNIMLRDDKQYFFVNFDNENFSEINLVHQPISSSDIGPFTDGSALKTTLQYLRKIFPYCTCKQKHNNYCLNYHIGNCPGFCCLKNYEPNKKELVRYNNNIAAIKKILLGEKNTVLKDLERKMKILAEEHNFDEAIQIRGKLVRLNRVFDNARIIKNLDLEKNATKNDHAGLIQLKKVFHLKKIPSRIEGYDISNIQGTGATGAMVAFKNGQASKSEYRKFKIKTVKGANDTAMLGEILTRRFGHPEWPMPDLILVDGGKGQLSAAGACAPAGIPILALTKNDAHHGDHVYASTLKTAIKLAQLSKEARDLLLSIDSEAHRFAINYHHKLSGRRMLS